MRILYDLTPYNDLVENKPPGIFLYILYFKFIVRAEFMVSEAGGCSVYGIHVGCNVLAG
jgi:hypothetical protein